MWVPDEATLERSHVYGMMRSVGVAEFSELHRWTIEHRDAFWKLVIEDLGIVFEAPPSAIRGSHDPEAPDWLPDARFNIVDSCLRGSDASIAIVVGSRSGLATVTMGELRRQVARFASGFHTAGFAVGDRIAIAMPMTVEAVIAYLGTIAAGGVVVSIADSFAPDEIRVRLDITDPVAVVTQDQTARNGRELAMYSKCAAASDTPCVVVDTGVGIGLREQDVGWSDFLGDGEDLVTVSRSADAHTNVLFSSGTTGEPKAIPWSQTTPIKAAMDGRFHQDIHGGDVVAWPTNLGWMMGPWLIYAALLNGAVIALYDDAPTTGDFIRFVEDAGVTMLGLVPSIVSAWRTSGVLRRGDWTTVRVISSTGEASNPDDYSWLMAVAGDVPVVEYCGGTEIGGGYITGTVVQPAFPSRFTTPALGLDVVLLDEQGNEADVGEVFLAGPSIGMSETLLNRDHHEVYFDGVPQNPRHLRRHGDQMILEVTGAYRALGRVDDTMNLGGIKVSSAELEETIGDIDGVSDLAAVAVPPPDGGPDRLVVFCVTTDPDQDPEAIRAAMQAEIRTHLNPLFRIHEVVVVDALPRTASQKVMRRVLREGIGE
jgi:acetyl-CoA synthetase